MTEHWKKSAGNCEHNRAVTDTREQEVVAIKELRHQVEHHFSKKIGSIQLTLSTAKTLLDRIDRLAATPSASARETAEKIVSDWSRGRTYLAPNADELVDAITSAIAPYEEWIRELEEDAGNESMEKAYQRARSEKAEAALARTKGLLHDAANLLGDEDATDQFRLEFAGLIDRTLTDIEKAE